MTNFAELPQYLQQRLRSELKLGESITWSGQPSPRRYMKDGFKLWFFFVPWTAFSLFWIAGAARFRWPTFEHGWDMFPLFGLPFLLVGLAGLSGPFWLHRKASSIIYAITNQRALSIEGVNSITIKSYLVSDIRDVERTEHQDGYGDLMLNKEQYRDGDGDRQTRAQGFYAIADVRGVERLIDNLIRDTRV